MYKAVPFELYYAADELLSERSNDDCACQHALGAPTAIPLADSALLQCTQPQQRIPLSDEHTIVFVPSASRVAVANQATLDLLDRFRAPLSLEYLDIDEQAAARQLQDAGLLCVAGMTAGPPAPAESELSAWLHVTNACNLRCTYCYIEKDDEAMTAETAFAAIDAIMRSAMLHGYAAVRLKYAGGEASLNLPLVQQMHRYAEQQANASRITLYGVVLSNGVGLTRHKLQQIHALGLRLMISLDGPPEVHDAQRPRVGGQGSFAAVAASIARAQQLGLNLTISVTITGASATSLPVIVRWLLERQLHFTLNFYRECDPSTRYSELKLDEHRLIEGMRAAYAEIAQHLPRYSLLGCLLDRTNLGTAHDRTCAAGESYLVIDHHGSVSACQMDQARPVTTIWERDPLNVIRLQQAGLRNLPVDQKEGCRDCMYKYWCAGGCAMATFRATGRYDIKSPNCGIYQALYPDVIRLEGQRLLHWANRSS